MYERYQELCRVGLPDAFWDRFVADYWDRKAGVFPGAERAPLASPADAARGLLDLLADPRKHAQLSVMSGQGEKFDSGRFRTLDLAEGRQRAELGLEHVTRWLCEGLGCSTVFAYVNRVHNVAAELWLKSRAFAHPLATRVGLPQVSLDLDFFFGNYQVTPTRIHRDAGNLTFVLEGRKKFLVWPFETFLDHEEVARNPVLAREEGSFLFENPPALEDWRDRAIVLEGGPGDIIYWPGGYWHIAEAVGSAHTATFTVSYLESGVQAIEDAINRIKHVSGQRPRAYVNKAVAWPDGSNLLDTLASHQATALTLLDDARAEVQKGPSTLASLVRLSSFWTSDPPAMPPDAGHVTAETELVADPRFPILACDGKEVGAPPAALALVCCGQVLLTARLGGLTEALIERLNTGAPLSVASFLRSRGAALDDPDRAARKLSEVAAHLVASCGAFVRG